MSDAGVGWVDTTGGAVVVKELDRWILSKESFFVVGFVFDDLVRVPHYVSQLYLVPALFHTPERYAENENSRCRRHRDWFLVS